MKKLLLILLCLPLIGLSQNVNIPDPNFKAYLVGDSTINTNGDAEIQVSEASAFNGAIGCGALNIYDLTGIEAFTALTSLSCYDNQLTSLDVSQNTALTYLALTNNQLTSLDVSQNTALTTLYVGGMNAFLGIPLIGPTLTSLNVNGAAALQILSCGYTLFTSLDVSQNTALTHLNVSNNPNLTCLNVANGNNMNFSYFSTISSSPHVPVNTSLVCIEVDSAAWSTANWIQVNGQVYFSEDCNNACSATYGCTNSLALNYNPLATVDDSSCIYCANDTSYTNITACNSYAWNGQSYTTSGAYSYTYTNALGCDSTAILNLTINYSNTGSTLVTACNSYTWDGVAYTTSGAYNSTYTNVAGCDSVHTLNLTILPPPENLFFSEYAEGSSSNRYLEIYNPTLDTIDLTNYALARVSGNPGNGIGIYEYWADFDSGAVILPNDVYIVAHSSADTLILAEANMLYTSLSNGDDGFALVYGNNPGTPTSPFNGNYQILDWLGDWMGDPGQGWEVAGVNNGTRDHTLVRKCDVIQGDTSWVNSAGTDPVNSQWIVLGNNDWSDIGQHIISPCVLIYGCTDTLACNFDTTSSIDDGSCIYPGQMFQSSITICNGESLTVGSSVYSTTGVFSDTLVSSLGCDSIVQTNLTIFSQTSLYDTIFGGIPDTSSGGGNFYSGSQYLELSCYETSDLISALIFSQDTALTTFEISNEFGNVLYDVTVTVIPGGHRVYFNYHLTAGSNYRLGVSGQSNNLFRHNSGVNYPYNFETLAAVTSSSAGGNYYYFFYDIEMRQSPALYSLCDGDSITIAGSVYSSTGSYTDSLISSFGCDSLVYSNVVVSTHVSYMNNQTICNGETYLINGNIYDSTGVYIDSLTTLNGCDSIVTTNLYIDSIVGGISINYDTICVGDSIMVGSNIYYNEGVYNDTIISSNGCDSIITTTLSVISANYSVINGGILDTAASPGDYSNYDGHLILDVGILSLLKSANVYALDTNTITFELRDDNGGLIQAVTHTVYPGLQRLMFNFIIQPGTDYQLGIDGGNSGLYRNNAGNGNSLAYPFDIGPVSITSSNAGDQYYYFYYDIEIMPYGTYIFSNICDGDSVIVGSSIYDTTGRYIDIFNASNSCDSIVYTNLLIDYNTSSYDTLSVNNVILWNGMNLSVSGDYSVTLINSSGCDSIVNLNLTITTTGILDIANESKLIKIVDVLGQEAPHRKRTPLFYIYDDGTVEKKIIIE